MASPDQTPEQRELTLVGKVEMRIALAATDDKLQTTLQTYLAPLLLKLASPHEAVRKKVISICQHVNTRIQPRSIQLPVAALVKQFKHHDNALIRHFDLLYIQQGVTRLAHAEKTDLLPVVAHGIAKTGTHGAQIFYLLLRVLPAFPIPPRGSKEDVELGGKLELSDDDVEFLAARFAKFMLFVPQRPSTVTKTCPGLTTEEYAFFQVQAKDEWDPNAGGLNLTQTKTHVARLLASGLFNDKQRFLPALCASADPASVISDLGDDMLKRATPATDLEDEGLIKTLFDLYFGEGSAPRVRPALRLKIINLLNKSNKSTTFASRIIKLVDDGVASSTQDGEDTIMSNGPPQNVTIGREVLKLRTAIFTYINFVARFGSKQTLHTIAPQVISRLRDFIEHQGWPKPGQSEDLTSRAYAYEVIGLLAKAGPRALLIEDDSPSLDLLRWLFDSLARDASGNSITVSIEESLSTILGTLGRVELSQAEQGVLEGLLTHQMLQSADLEANQRLRSTRYTAVRFANRCLPFASVQARWVNVLAMGAVGDRTEVREEGQRGLSPYWHRMLNGSGLGTDDANFTFPAFEDVTTAFFHRQVNITSPEPVTIVRRAKDLHPSSFTAMTGFVRRMLVQQALQRANVPVNLDNDWERRLDTMVESDASARDAVKSHIAHLTATSPSLLDTLVCALFECAISTSSAAEDHLVEFLALSPDQLIHNHLDRISELFPIIKSNNHSNRMSAGHAFGILASHGKAKVTAFLAELSSMVQSWDTAVGAGISAVHGSVIALGFYFSRLAGRGYRERSGEELSIFLPMLFKMLSTARDDLLQEAAHVAIGQMCMFHCLTIEMIEKHTALREVSDKLYAKAKDGKEHAILCLGQVSMVLAEDSEDLRYIQTNLHKLHEIRQSEVHFTVGESLSYLAAGWDSDALTTKLDVDVGDGKIAGQQRKHTLNKLVDQVLADCANTKPSLKKAAVMWLLCLVQFCGAQLQNRLAECQSGFRRCLADRDELVQETASRGLGLVYEKGDRKLKDDLVRDLVSSFSSDKQQLSGTVSADTQLFEPGALPTGDGSVSTYKDIMSLAAEVGDSSLVYKFMSMASSNAIWSSRAAFGRFGLSRVLSDSSVDGYLAHNPKLYPKLFRYRFDPSSGVQRSMNEIWQALVPDSAATIDKHFDAIMEDLLASILGKEWRVRQACCAAIADLVSGRPLEKYEPYLERIWTQCFKVLDDIKESVRAAAASLARSLTGVLTRSLEADHSATKNASAMLKHVLPFLLSPSGMESSAQEVQMFAVRTLLEIIKKASGATLRPFIPDLVDRLIGLLSSLEPEAVNYIHLNASKYNLTEQKIDDMRLSNVRSSPLMEAIERCLDLLDDDTMRQLQPRMESAAKNAVGLPSKVGSSRVLVSLATRRMVLFRPYADDALRLVMKLVIDRNDTVSSSYAAAAGYIARGASDKQILHLIDFAKKLYFDSAGDRESVTPRRSIASGELMYAFSKNASDKFGDFATSALPFVFVAKHDSHEQVKEHFQDTWNEAVGGSRAVQLYLQEILELCVTHLDSPQWTLKHTAARTVADATTAVASGEGEIPTNTAEMLWPALDKALGGKTWEGKEVVLSAFAKFVESARSYYMNHESVRSAILKIAIREAKRQNVTYRQHSIPALARIALARVDVDMSDAIFDVVHPILAASPDPDDNDDAMDVDATDRGRKAEEVRDHTLAGAITALFASVNPQLVDGDALARVLARVLRDVRAALNRVGAVPAVLRATFDAARDLFARMGESGRRPALDDEAAAEDLRAVLFGQAVAIEAVRLMRAEAVARMPASLMTAEMAGTVRDARDAEPSAAVRSVLDSAAGHS